MYVFRVMVRSVMMAIARIEKSAACTDHWPTHPFRVQAGPGLIAPLLATAYMPLMELFNELMKSAKARFKTSAWRKERC